MKEIRLPEPLTGEALKEWATQVTQKLNVLDVLDMDELGRRLEARLLRAQRDRRVLREA